jgi:hypothetical protein
MTGKITVGTIQDTDGNTVASTYVTNGVAKAWANADANAATITSRDSLNISSWTDYGTGNFGLNLNNSMADTNYAFYGIGEAGGAQNCAMLAYNKDADVKTTSGCRWYAVSTSYTIVANPTQASVMYLGDLA